MHTAEMFWGRTTWWPGDAGRWSDGVDLTGFLFGQGPVESCGPFFNCSGKRGQVRILSQFFLGEDRMPISGCTFHSRPVVHFTGTLRAGTGTSMTIFDDPRATCYIELRQIIISGGTIIRNSMTTERLIRTPEENRVERERIMPAVMAFRPLTFDLNRTRLLEIHLDTRFKFILDGPAAISFSRSEDDLPFIVDTPQWSIRAES